MTFRFGWLIDLVAGCEWAAVVILYAAKPFQKLV